MILWQASSLVCLDETWLMQLPSDAGGDHTTPASQCFPEREGRHHVVRAQERLAGEYHVGHTDIRAMRM